MKYTLHDQGEDATSFRFSLFDERGNVIVLLAVATIAEEASDLEFAQRIVDALNKQDQGENNDA